MSHNEEAFHSKAAIYHAIQHQRAQLQSKVAQLSEQNFRATSDEQIVAGLAQEFSINVPVLDESAVEPTKRDVNIDISRDRSRAGFGLTPQGTVKGTEITIAVPYTGDSELFRLHASSHTMDYPVGRIEKSRIVFTRQGRNLDAQQVRREFDAWLSRIKEHLNGMRTELANFNESLHAAATTAVQARRDKFKRDDDLLNGLGFSAAKKSQ